MRQDRSTFRIEIPEDIPHGTRIDSYIADGLRLCSRSQVKRRVADLRVGGQPVKVHRRLQPGETLEFLLLEPPASTVHPEPIQLDVLYEDANVLVVNKPRGMVVHPASGNWSGTLVNAILGHCSEVRKNFPQEEARPGIVHRLDKDTSGVIIAAKTPQAREYLSRQFRARQVSKRYLAIVSGRPPAPGGRLDMRIARDPRNRKRFTCLPADSGTGGGKRALTEYRVLRRRGSLTLLSLMPLTGRTHQLRVHMAHLGCPIVGDRLYGWRAHGGEDPGLMLHAHWLRLRLPGDSWPRTFRAPVPRRFAALLYSV